MEGLAGVVIEEKRKPKRIYIRPSTKISRNIKKIKKVQKGFPKEVFCKVCYKKIPFEDAIYRLGVNGTERGGYYMCKEHI